jgi:hypothetical protein
MADRTIAEVPTVDALLRHGGLMQHTMLRVIRNTATNSTLDAPTRLQRIVWLADQGLSAPLDDESRVLYESLERELTRVTGILHRVSGR